MVIYIFLILFSGLIQNGYSEVTILKLPERIENNHLYLTLGDIFPPGTLGISDLNRSRVLLRMPPPGQEIILKSEDIQHFLMLYAIDIPVILRDIKIISPEISSSPESSSMSLEEFLIQHLQQKYGSGPWSIKIQTGLMDQDVRYTFHEAVVEQTSLKDRCLECLIFFPSSNTYLNVQATVAQHVKVPVLNRLVMPTEIIGTDDIQWIEVKLEDMSAACVLKVEELIHFTPIQPLQSGILIKKSLLKKPKVIHRGNLISLVLQTPYMVLTQRKAQAMEDGAVGDRIKVCNLDTKRIIMGTVKNSSVVEVHS